MTQREDRLQRVGGMRERSQPQREGEDGERLDVAADDLARPAHLRAAQIAGLQRAIGNRHVEHILRATAGRQERIQRNVTGYRIQDNDKKKKRVDVDEGSADITFNDPPINLSFGSPDHAVYFAQGKSGSADVITFEVSDDFYNELMAAAVPQKDAAKNPTLPTINDPSKPGVKIEFRATAGDWIARLQNAVQANSARVYTAPQFFEANKQAFSPQSVIDFANTIIATYPALKARVTKIMKDNGLGTKSPFVCDDSNDEYQYVRWDEVKKDLWVEHNKGLDKSKS